MSHPGHRHRHDVNERRTLAAAVLTGGFMLVEVAGGVLSGSLALLADAGHMLIDFLSLALAWLAFRVSRRPSDWKRTYGFDRFQVLAAFTNGITLTVVALWILVEAIGRLRAPVPILGGTMLAVAAAGLAVNVVAFALLHGADRDNLNVRAAAAHLLGDLLGSVAAVLAAAVVLATGWTPIDPLLSMLVVALILRSALGLVRDAGHILLEGSPHGLDVREIGPDLVATVEAVRDVHHVHAWSITQQRTMATLHARVDEGADAAAAIAAIKERLRARFRIGHATVEIETGHCPEAPPADLAASTRAVDGEVSARERRDRARDPPA